MTANLSRLTLAALWITLLAGCQATSTPATQSGPAAADLPPAGSVWFGSSFDPATFVVHGRTTTVPAGQPVAVVAHLSHSIDMSAANLRISLDGTNYLNQALGLAGEGDVYGMTFSPPAAGHYLVEVADVGGNVVASSSFDAR